MRDGTVFVGRSLAVTELTARLERVCRGAGALILVAGEAGIGKTALVERLAETAGEREMRVLWGGCWEADGQPPYWPFVQMLRRFVAEHGWSHVVNAVGEDAPWLGPLLPERDSTIRPPSSSGEQARFRLFDTFTRLLTDSARERPILLVVDDLHWADEGTLRYLDFLGHQLREARILVVATYRDVDAGSDTALYAHLPALTRLGSRIDLGGMTVGEVDELIRAITGAVPDADRVAEVHRRSGGNPLFAGEVARSQLTVEPLAGFDAVPAGVSHVVNSRLARLPGETVELLELAAVLGNGFDVRELAQMAGRTVLQTREALEEPLRGRILAADTGGHRMEFLHALVRDTLYGRLGAPERAALHQRAGEALAAREASEAGIAGEGASRLAHHFALGGSPERAIDYLMRAGEHALRSLAYEDAAGHFRRALNLQNTIEANEARRRQMRCQILLQLAEAQWRSGDRQLAGTTYSEALGLARLTGDADAMAHAALGCCVRYQLWLFDPQLVRQLEEALGVLGEADSDLRARLLAKLARVLYLDPASASYRAEIAEQAIAMARRLGDPATLAEALSGRPLDSTQARLDVANEIYRLAARVSDEELMLECQLWRVMARLEAGDRNDAELVLADYGTMADKRRVPLWRFYHRCAAACMARLDGRFDESEALIREAAALGHQAKLPRADVICQHHLANLALDRGQRPAAEEAIAALSVHLAQRPLMPAYVNSILSRLQVAMGSEMEGWACLDRFLEEGARPVVVGPVGAVSLVLLAEMADSVGASKYAESLFEALRPYVACVAVTTRVVYCAGPVAESLGLLAALLGRLDEAERYFETALAMAKKMAARPWLARIHYRYARLLLDRSRHGDSARGLELARAAREEAAALGMRALRDDADTLLNGLRGLHGLPGLAISSATPHATQQSAALRREGDYWSLDWSGKVLRLRHSKGLLYLAQLLSRPQVELHALQMVESSDGVHPEGRAWLLLDDAAKTSYRRRIEDLQEQLAEAESFHDPERAGKARQEIDALTQELARAVGLGGRDRLAGSAAERARLNVTRSVRSVIARIGEVHADLGHHLNSTVRTGTFCVYEPGPRPPIVWRF